MTAIERYLSRFFQKLGVSFAGNVLDVGCGDGRIAREIARRAKSVVGVDVDRHEQWATFNGDNLRFEVGDAEALDFASSSFDGVFAINMLHHTSDPARAIAEIVRVCKPEGTVVIVEPNRYNPLGYVHLTLMGDHQHFPTRRFQEMLRGPLPDFEMKRFECHCYPGPSALIGVAERVEDTLDRMSIWRPWLFYNAAIAGLSITGKSIK